jgi:hypothetical protein
MRWKWAGEFISGAGKFPLGRLDYAIISVLSEGQFWHPPSQQVGRERQAGELAKPGDFGRDGASEPITQVKALQVRKLADLSWDRLLHGSCVCEGFEIGQEANLGWEEVSAGWIPGSSESEQGDCAVFAKHGFATRMAWVLTFASGPRFFVKHCIEDLLPRRTVRN